MNSEAFEPLNTLTILRVDSRSAYPNAGLGRAFSDVGLSWILWMACLLVLPFSGVGLAAATGSVVAWGNVSATQTNLPEGAKSGVVAVSAGFDHILALRLEDPLWRGDGTTTASPMFRMARSRESLLFPQDIIIRLRSRTTARYWPGESMITGKRMCQSVP